MIYTLSNDNTLRIEYQATTDQATPVNLTNHAFWNLAGAGTSVLDHELTLHAKTFLPVDETLIPNGTRAGVAGTPMDFTKPHAIGERIEQVPGGYDHCYILAREGSGLSLAAELFEPKERPAHDGCDNRARHAVLQWQFLGWQSVVRRRGV